MNSSINKIIKLITLLVVDILAAIGGYQLNRYLDENYWYLRHENQPLMRFLMTGGIIVGILAVLAVNVVLLLSLRKKAIPVTAEEDLHTLKEKFMAGSSSGEHTAEDFLKLFQNVKIEKPNLSFLMDEAIKQIDTFYDDKGSIEKVMRLQNISYPPILHAVEEAERGLLKNMRYLLVDISVWNPKQVTDEERKDSYLEIYQSIEKKLEINKKNLKSFHDLLMRVRTLKTEDVAEDTTIKALIKALE